MISSMLTTEALKPMSAGAVCKPLYADRTKQPGRHLAPCVWLALLCYSPTHSWHSSSYTAALSHVFTPSLSLLSCLLLPLHFMLFLNRTVPGGYFPQNLSYNVKLSQTMSVTEWVRENGQSDKAPDGTTDNSRLSWIFLGSCQGQWLTSWKIAFHNSASLQPLVSPALSRPLSMCVWVHMSVCTSLKTNKSVSNTWSKRWTQKL